MLKTSFGKAFCLSNSFLLFTVPSATNPIQAHTVYLKDNKSAISTSLLAACEIKIGHIPSGLELNLSKKPEKLSSPVPQITLNTKGMLFVRKYIKNSGECLDIVKKRSLLPFYIIDSVFNLYGLPVELKYLAVIESELKSTALSPVGARGPWQLMPATAHVLGLKITRRNDERTNYYKSTIAAARYLKDLYTEFNDWLLVLAAYNGGPGPVYTAIRKSGSKNFWKLQDYLPSESREHVKKFIATHYFFEGRGSETTLTRAENIKYRKNVNAFVRSRQGSAVTEEMKIESDNTCVIDRFLVTQNDMFQPFGFEIYGMSNNFQKYQLTGGKTESSDKKFQRLMKESEESLKKSLKIIEYKIHI